jgi:hypothetical protein
MLVWSVFQGQIGGRKEIGQIGTETHNQLIGEIRL